MKLSSIKVKQLIKAALFILLLAAPITSPVHADELAERNAIESTVRELVARQDFAELEKIAASFLNDRARTSSGLWKIGLFDDAITYAFRCKCSDDAFWDGAEESMKGWIKKYPESINAHLAYAHVLLEKGWSIRGLGYTDSVAPENWKPFHEQLGRICDNGTERTEAGQAEANHKGNGNGKWMNAIRKGKQWSVPLKVCIPVCFIETFYEQYCRALLI